MVAWDWEKKEEEALEAESTLNWRSAAYLSRLGLRLWRATTVEETRRRPGAGGGARGKGSRSGEGPAARRKVAAAAGGRQRP